MKLHPLRLLALVAALVLAFAVSAPAAAIGDGPVAAAAKGKKKCGKKGKKAVAAKKCGKRMGGSAPAPVSAGPELPAGDYYCDYGSFQVQPGHRYTVNRADPGSYTYNAANGIVNFKGGSYGFMFGKFDPDSKTLDLYSNDATVLPVGTYGWSCSQ